MEAKKELSLKWVVIIFACLITSLGIYIFILLSGDTTDKDVADLLDDYEELERAYENVIDGTTGVINNDTKSVEQLKSELGIAIQKLKIEQKRIAARRPKDTTEMVSDISTPSMFDTLNIGLNQEDIDLVLRLQKELDKKKSILEDEAKNLNKYYEDEKAKNQAINTKLSTLKEELNRMKSPEWTDEEAIARLTKQKEELQAKLGLNNKQLKEQSQTINKMRASEQKASVDCYFVYEKGHSELEAKVYLTRKRMSKLYFDYFTNKKPTLYVEFEYSNLRIRKSDKFNIKISNSKNKEIYSINKSFSKHKLKLEVEGKLFEQDSYYIELKKGSKNLLSGSKYSFKVNYQ